MHGNSHFHKPVGKKARCDTAAGLISNLRMKPFKVNPYTVTALTQAAISAEQSQMSRLGQWSNYNKINMSELLAIARLHWPAWKYHDTCNRIRKHNPYFQSKHNPFEDITTSTSSLCRVNSKIIWIHIRTKAEHHQNNNICTFSRHTNLFFSCHENLIPQSELSKTANMQAL